MTPMTKAERNKEIYRQYRTGVDVESISSRFDVWSREIYSIAYSDENGAWQRLGEKVRLEMREHNDINRKYSVISIIDALQLIARPRNVFSDYSEWCSRQLSLKEFMDIIVPDKPNPNRLYGCTNVMNLRNMGRQGFWNILEQLSTLDLGEKVTVEWNRKLELLRKYGRQQDLPRFVFYGFQKEIRAC